MKELKKEKTYVVMPLKDARPFIEPDSLVHVNLNKGSDNFFVTKYIGDNIEQDLKDVEFVLCPANGYFLSHKAIINVCAKAFERVFELRSEMLDKGKTVTSVHLQYMVEDALFSEDTKKSSRRKSEGIISSKSETLNTVQEKEVGGIKTPKATSQSLMDEILLNTLKQQEKEDDKALESKPESAAKGIYEQLSKSPNPNITVSSSSNKIDRSYRWDWTSGDYPRVAHIEDKLPPLEGQPFPPETSLPVPINDGRKFQVCSPSLQRVLNDEIPSPISGNIYHYASHTYLFYNVLWYKSLQ